ncbi:MAG: LysM peptidoglycan-binding domain-containing protein [Myxococcales bacterium]|nr:LysM peptidoglycan-binding domain-containing protein [Myxococcales bacterium]
MSPRTLSLLLGTALSLGGTAASAQKLITMAADDLPEEYVVEPGDTLWDICKEFFADPWVWPTVWSLNPHVTNPHWIYPGDIIRLYVPAGAEGIAGGLPTLTYVVGSAQASHVSRGEGYIAEAPPERKGVLSRAPKSKRYLAEYDIVYLQMDELDKARPGQRFSTYRVLNDVVHPETGDELGQKVLITGVVEITGVDEHFARAKVTDSYVEMERGDLLMPERAHNVRIAPKQNLIDLEGYVVDDLRPIQNIGTFNVVFIDRGEKDGIQVGNRIFVFRKGDDYLDLDDEAREKLPSEQIGELLVVDTQGRTATALVTREAREIHRGDKLVMERNY